MLTNFIAEMRERFSQQDSKLEKLSSAIEEIENQNSEIQTSIEFLTAKCESLTENVSNLQKENLQQLKYIQALESRIDAFERSARSTCVEIKNIPIG